MSSRRDRQDELPSQWRHLIRNRTTQLAHFRCVIFFTPEHPFRKLSPIEMEFSRTRFLALATDV
jgi:hypothetical protein